MTDKEFCKLYTSFFGEEIDNIKQLKMHSFNGEELLEFAEHVVKYITSNTMLVGDSEQLKAFADYAQKRMWEDGDKDLSDFVDEFLRL